MLSINNRLALLGVLSIILSVQFISAVKITEAELNPLGSDSGSEWIELYSEEEINLNEYKIMNNDDNEISFNESFVFSGYFAYIFEKQWLDNSDEKIFLYKNSELIDETELFNDVQNDDKTWQLCSEIGWQFKDNTKNKENVCEKEESEKKSEEINGDEKEESKTEENIDKEIINIVYNKTSDVNNLADKNLEIIKLTPKDIKTEDDKDSIGMNKYAIYGFVFFCVLLFILFMIKKKGKNEIV